MKKDFENSLQYTPPGEDSGWEVLMEKCQDIGLGGLWADFYEWCMGRVAEEGSNLQQIYDMSNEEEAEYKQTGEHAAFYKSMMHRSDFASRNVALGVSYLFGTKVALQEMIQRAQKVKKLNQHREKRNNAASAENTLTKIKNALLAKAFPWTDLMVPDHFREMPLIRGLHPESFENMGSVLQALIKVLIKKDRKISDQDISQFTQIMTWIVELEQVEIDKYRYQHQENPDSDEFAVGTWVNFLIDLMGAENMTDSLQQAKIVNSLLGKEISHFIHQVLSLFFNVREELLLAYFNTDHPNHEDAKIFLNKINQAINPVILPEKGLVWLEGGRLSQQLVELFLYRSFQPDSDFHLGQLYRHLLNESNGERRDDALFQSLLDTIQDIHRQPMAPLMLVANDYHDFINNYLNPSEEHFHPRQEAQEIRQKAQFLFKSTQKKRLEVKLSGEEIMPGMNALLGLEKSQLGVDFFLTQEHMFYSIYFSKAGSEMGYKLGVEVDFSEDEVVVFPEIINPEHLPRESRLFLVSLAEKIIDHLYNQVYAREQEMQARRQMSEITYKPTVPNKKMQSQIKKGGEPWKKTSHPETPVAQHYQAETLVKSKTEVKVGRQRLPQTFILADGFEQPKNTPHEFTTALEDFMKRYNKAADKTDFLKSVEDVEHPGQETIWRIKLMVNGVNYRVFGVAVDKKLTVLYAMLNRKDAYRQIETVINKGERLVEDYEDYEMPLDDETQDDDSGAELV
jgi:hypothetical protein